MKTKDKTWTLWTNDKDLKCRMYLVEYYGSNVYSLTKDKSRAKRFTRKSVAVNFAKSWQNKWVVVPC